MTFMMKLNEEREEGREEGRAEERLNSLAEVLWNGGNEDDLRRLHHATDEEIQMVRDMQGQAVLA